MSESRATASAYSELSIFAQNRSVFNLKSQKHKLRESIRELKSLASMHARKDSHGNPLNVREINKLYNCVRYVHDEIEKQIQNLTHYNNFLNRPVHRHRPRSEFEAYAQVALCYDGFYQTQKLVEESRQEFNKEVDVVLRYFPSRGDIYDQVIHHLDRIKENMDLSMDEFNRIGLVRSKMESNAEARQDLELERQREQSGCCTLF